METEVDIKDFEKRVVKTFCDEYLRKAFAFIKTDSVEINKLQSVEQLVKLLMDSEFSRDGFFLYESWIDDTFNGFEKSIEKCLLNFSPPGRKRYRDDEYFKKQKDWLYEVFRDLHQTLLKHSKEVRELNEITGDWDPHPLYFRLDGSQHIDHEEMEEYNRSVRNSISNNEYADRLSALYARLTGVKKIDDYITNKKISPEIIRILSAYFRRKPKNDEAIRYINECDLAIESKTICYKKIDDFLSKVSRETNSESETTKGYAQYLYQKGDLKKKDVSGGANSLKSGARDRLFQRLYYEVLSIYLAHKDDKMGAF